MSDRLDYGHICEKGHVVDYDAEDAEIPYLTAYCPQCGSKVIGRCPGCEQPIWIDLHAPAYCSYCGDPYPWTMEAMSALEAAAEFADLEAIEREKLMKAAPDLFRDNPRTELAAMQTKRVLKDLHGDARAAIVSILIQYGVTAATKYFT